MKTALITLIKGMVDYELQEPGAKTGGSVGSLLL